MVDFPGLQRFQRMKVSSVGIDIYLDPQTSKPSVLWDRTWLLMPRTETFCGGRFCSCNVVHVITTNEILYNIYTNIRDFWQKIGLSTTTKMFQILCDYWSYCMMVFTLMLKTLYKLHGDTMKMNTIVRILYFLNNSSYFKLCGEEVSCPPHI